MKHDVCFVKAVCDILHQLPQCKTKTIAEIKAMSSGCVFVKGTYAISF
jgi:hypothetical protein